MENVASKQCFTFPCDRWLAKDEDDGEIIRELPATGDAIKKPLPCKLCLFVYIITYIHTH